MQQGLISVFVSKTETQTKPRRDSSTLPTQANCTLLPASFPPSRNPQFSLRLAQVGSTSSVKPSGLHKASLSPSAGTKGLRTQDTHQIPKVTLSGGKSGQ